MKHGDPRLHVRGESVFVDDLPMPPGGLYASVLGSPLAHGKILKLDTTAALAQPGVAAVVTAEQIPGENQIGAIIPDEPLLAHGQVHHVGQPVAVVLADTPAHARRAREHVTLEIDPLPVVTDPREAAGRGQFIVPPRTFACGDTEQAWAECAHVVEGRVDTGAQEHFYLEPQGALAEPREDGTLLVHSSTQAPTAVQRQIAKVLDLPMHAVQVDVRRLGGGFGGKEDQATPWAAMCALGTRLTGRAVRLVLPRGDDMIMTGKRHPYTSDYKLGLDAQGNLLAYEVTMHQNAGSAADLSPAVLERSLFHATGSYFVPNVRATAMSCRTNMVPHTAFRGFGGPQAMVVIEAALAAAARAMGVPTWELQRKNLLRDGQVLPYGQTVENARAEACWDRVDIASMAAGVEQHNRDHADTKRGLALMPVCFGISFTNTSMNQAGALVHVYTDGSVSVSTGAVEMGQGVNQKIRRIAAVTLGIGIDHVRVETTNTTRVANTSPTAASSGADMNGMAARTACLQIASRLRTVAARLVGAGDPEKITIRDGRVHHNGVAAELGWNELVLAAHMERVDLAAHGFYATPRLHFDKSTEKGRPFAYHVFGTAAITVTLDLLRGTSRVEHVHVVHDGGRLIEPQVDLGQVEGAMAQGLGWMLLEDARWDADGHLLHDTAGKYKVPDLDFMPERMDTEFLPDAANPEAVLGSKAVGEPPLMYGIGGLFALRQAILAANPDLDARRVVAPLTPERILQLLNEETTA